MPQDTTYKIVPYIDTAPVDTTFSRQQMDSLMQVLINEPVSARKKDDDGGTFPVVISVLFLATLIICFAWVIIIRLKIFGNAHLGTLFVNRKSRKRVSSILAQFFPYYNQLPENKKDEFVRRTICFKRSKNFKFQHMEKSDEPCYLVSASAIQLTFGLDDFMLDYFTTIYIINGEYRHYAYATPFQGHTSNGEIYLSWPHFKYGYEQNDDKQNVGLHEMAHALTWQCFYADATGDHHFTKTFYHYSQVGRPLFARMQAGELNMLGSYAATNYDEFWATSVEVFFEQPGQMKKHLPDLYNVMCKLLRQDPCAE